MSLKVEKITTPLMTREQSISKEGKDGLNIGHSQKDQQLSRDFLELCLKKRRQREKKEKREKSRELNCY